MTSKEHRTRVYSEFSHVGVNGWERAMDTRFGPGKFRMRYCRWALGLVLLVFVPKVGLGEKPATFQKLGEELGREIRPILNRHCMECHAADVQEGTLDLERFAQLDGCGGDQNVAQGGREAREWRDAAQERPTACGLKDKNGCEDGSPAISRPRPGQRGRSGTGGLPPVQQRRIRLHRARFDGFDMQPAREFPADGNAREGFTDPGNALVMSPALLSKYLDAGKKIAAHAVLLPDQIRFSPGGYRRQGLGARPGTSHRIRRSTRGSPTQVAAPR